MGATRHLRCWAVVAVLGRQWDLARLSEATETACRFVRQLGCRSSQWRDSLWLASSSSGLGFSLCWLVAIRWLCWRLSRSAPELAPSANRFHGMFGQSWILALVGVPPKCPNNQNDCLLYITGTWPVCRGKLWQMLGHSHVKVTVLKRSFHDASR